MEQNQQESLHIGSFSGYVRRPVGDKSGLTAQFYGENGDDADMISALSLTKFLETPCFLKVYLVKNAIGQIMKKNNEYPLIASCTCTIQRPKPQRDGMIAQFFGGNGPDADQINQLGLSKYLDAFVYVEILKPEAAPETQDTDTENSTKIDLSPPSSDLDALSKLLTPSERKALAKRAKIYHEANRLLKATGFLALPSVWSALGNEVEFLNWLESSPCCTPGDISCSNQSFAFKIPGDNLKFYYVPLCKHHAHQVETAQFEGGIQVLRVRHRELIQIWAWEKIKEVVGLEDGMEDPNPQKVMTWAFEKKLSSMLPPNYLSKF